MFEASLWRDLNNDCTRLSYHVAVEILDLNAVLPSPFYFGHVICQMENGEGKTAFRSSISTAT